MTLRKTMLCTSLALAAGTAQAVELEVTHWWTSGGEAAAVATFEEAWNATGNTWVDGAIWGSGGVARPIILSRILGGDPPAATQLQHGRQAEDLIKAGLLLDLTDLAEEGNWRGLINPVSLLDSCTVDGRVYCVPVNIHSWQWMWVNKGAFETIGVPTPTTWDEFVAAAPALEEAGIIPLAMGQQPWQTAGAFNVMATAIAGVDAWSEVIINKNADVAAGPEYARVFEAAANARALAAKSDVQEWNDATAMVIDGRAAAQIMGDWAQGEFQVAGQTAGVDYECLLGLGENEIISTGGDAFYFPINEDPEVTAAQKELAKLLISPEVQVSFNLAKGSLPVRGDIDLSAANDCMKKGLEVLAAGAILPNDTQTLSNNTNARIEDLLLEFWSNPALTAADAQARYAAIIAEAD